ncbi:RecT family recombinase [Brevibacillus brevis]|uniref:RecT family recombinase n=1 Tax=Brevibacillus brevis TaxID=1393 RepID=UPI001C8D2EDF|nr:RecT family recombinase [Brevibacillus brevis]MBY0088425.1 recombinase RecT [Brevibacillus brevis]
MSQALALMPFGELTEQDIVTVRETIAKDCNDSQFRLFMGIAKASGANPILQEIHPSVFQGKLTVQFGIDFHVRKAKETEGYLGYDVQLVHDNDTFKMHQEKAEDGRYYAVIDEHSWGFPRGKVVGGYAIAYKEGYAPFTVVMDVEEVEHFKRSQIGMQKTMWTNYFNDMFKKHMTRRALKAAFGLRFDDVEPADSSPASYEAPQRKDITPEVAVMEEKPQPQDEDDEVTQFKKAKFEMKKKFTQLGITETSEILAYIDKHAKPKGSQPTLAEITGLLKILDMHIAEQQEQAASEDELT